MKMRTCCTFIFQFRWLLMLSLIVIACAEKDITHPSIDLVLLNGLSGQHAHGVAGQTIQLHVTCSDNDELFQLKAEIHASDPNSAHHTTESEEYDEGIFSCPLIGNWEVADIKNIATGSASVDFNFVIPDSISGEWNIELTVLDNAGNTDDYFLWLHVFNDSLPAIVIDSITPAPTSNNDVHLSIGEQFTTYGHVIATHGIDTIYASFDGPSGIFIEQKIAGSGEWSYELENIAWSLLETPGTYESKIRCLDMSGFEYWKTLELHVSE